jgi:hypothetical protein
VTNGGRQHRTLNAKALREAIEGGLVGFRQNSTSYILWCPACSKQKLHIRKSDGRSKCFRCGDESRTWADRALAPILGRPHQELAEVLYGLRVGDGTASVTDIDLIDPWGEFVDDEYGEVVVEEALPPRMFDDPGFVHLDSPSGRRGLEYLQRRGITQAVAQKYGLRYLPRERRIIIPVVVDGVQRGWQGRYIGETEGFDDEGNLFSIPKVLTTGKLTGKVLMFEDTLRGKPNAIMVEGPFDGLKCDDCVEQANAGVGVTMGCGEAVAVLPRFIRAGVRNLYVGLDDDAAEHVMRVAHEMVAQEGVKLYKLEPPRGREDIGACSPGEVLEAFRSARPLRAGQMYVYLREPAYY